MEINECHADFETEVRDLRCIQCGTTYTGKVMLMDGRVLAIGQKLCPGCRETCEIQEARQQELQRAASEARRAAALETRWAQLCPVEFRLPSESEGHTDLNRLVERQPKARELLTLRLDARGLLLMGPTGTGKTRLAWRICRLIFEQGKRVVALTAGQLDRQCRDAAGNFTLTSWFARLAEADLLFVDDLGKGRWSEGTEAQAFDLIDQRHRERRPILVTTNLVGLDLEFELSANRGPALVRRLREFCEVIALT